MTVKIRSERMDRNDSYTTRGRYIVTRRKIGRGDIRGRNSEISRSELNGDGADG